ncbi:hypothetical protein EON83_26440 [bacterium]|nr:MAG: hypothetical protein EON83_26440 [bacterium]
MTEQEAEAKTARLTRIWKPPPVEDMSSWGKLRSLSDPNFFVFEEHIMRGVRFRYHYVNESTIKEGYSLILREMPSRKRIASLLYRPDWTICRESIDCDPEEHEPGEYDKITREFFAQWTDFFRCNCWLSGANIEASAHEKAQWLRGFTREEIEAWNLKF